jgi:hypothetical protein
MNPCVKQMRDATDYHIKQNKSRVSFIKDGAIVTESVRLPHESASVPSSSTTPVGLGTSFAMYCLMKYNSAIFKDAVLIENVGDTQGWKVGIVDQIKTQRQVYEKRVTLVLVNPVSTSKSITSFKIGSVIGTIDGLNISITLPHGTDVTALAPEITKSGKLISPASGVAQDFTTPKTYTVTALDLTSQTYTVAVTVSV